MARLAEIHNINYDFCNAYKYMYAKIGSDFGNSRCKSYSGDHVC